MRDPSARFRSPWPALCALIGVLALASPAASQSDDVPTFEEARELSDEVKDLCNEGTVESIREAVPYLDHPWTRVRDWAWEKLGEQDDPEVVRFLAEEALFANSSRIRGAVAEVLGRIGDEVAVEPLLRLADRDRENATEAIWALGRIGSREAFDPVAGMVEARDWRVRGEAYEALFRIDPVEAADLLRQGAEEDDAWQVRSRCLIFLSEPDEDAAFAIVSTLVEEIADDGRRDRRPWQLLLAACDVIRHLRDRESRVEELRTLIDHLIEILAHKTGRKAYEVAGALRALTGRRNVAPDHESWSLWWEVARDQWEPTDPGPEGEEASGRPSPEDVGTRVRFHGIPVVSDRLVFVIDLSGSMDEEITYDPEETERVGGTGTTSREEGGQEEDRETRRRVDLSKDQLGQTISRLDDETGFNLIFFAGELMPWQETLVPATRRNRQRCMRYVSQTDIPEGGRGVARGNFYAGIVAALSDPNADSMFFLSDGGPSHGEYILIDRLLHEVRKVNRYKRYSINTILFGESEAAGFHRRFMDRLASRNDGRYYPKY